MVTTDVDSDGIAIAANALELNGGTINLTADPSMAAALAHGAVTASTSHKVDGGAASISTVAFTNQPTGTYRTIGSHIEVTVTFDRPVAVTGTPRIPLSPALGPNSETRHAAYESVSSAGTTVLFRYVLVNGDNSGTNFVTLAANALELNNGTIRTGTANATLTHGTVNSNKLVNVSQPTISLVQWVTHAPGVDADLNGHADTFAVGDEIKPMVRFTHSVDVDNAGNANNISVVLTIGSTDYTLALGTGSTPSGVAFAAHTVVATDSDDNGITIKRDGSGNVIRLAARPSRAWRRSAATPPT